MEHVTQAKMTEAPAAVCVAYKPYQALTLGLFPSSFFFLFPNFLHLLPALIPPTLFPGPESAPLIPNDVFSCVPLFFF